MHRFDINIYLRVLERKLSHSNNIDNLHRCNRCQKVGAINTCIVIVDLNIASIPKQSQRGGGLFKIIFEINELRRLPSLVTHKLFKEKARERDHAAIHCWPSQGEAI